MNKFLISAAACTLLASSALAEVSAPSPSAAPVTNSQNSAGAVVNNTLLTPDSKALTDQSNPALQNAKSPDVVVTNSLPTPATEATNLTNTTPVVGNVTIEPVTPTVSLSQVEPVNLIPSIDQSFFASLVEAFNSKNIDSIVAAMSTNNVVFITSNGILIKDKEAIKNHLISMMTGDNPISISLSLDSGNLEPKPGIVFTTGSITKTVGITNENPEQSETHKETISALVGYENNQWKILAIQSTKVEEPKVIEPAQEEKSQSSGLRTLLALVLGAAAGFMGARFMFKKSAQV